MENRIPLFLKMLYGKTAALRHRPFPAPPSRDWATNSFIAHDAGNGAFETLTSAMNCAAFAHRQGTSAWQGGHR
jgi:hypothetical protein